MTGARYWSVWLLLGGLAYTTLITSPSAAQPSIGFVDLIDARLAEAIALYTGVAGRVDDERAHELMLEALEDAGPVTQMWLTQRSICDKHAQSTQHLRQGILILAIHDEGRLLDLDLELSSYTVAQGLHPEGAVSVCDIVTEFSPGTPDARDALPPLTT